MSDYLRDCAIEKLSKVWGEGTHTEERAYTGLKNCPLCNGKMMYIHPRCEKEYIICECGHRIYSEGNVREEWKGERSE